MKKLLSFGFMLLALLSMVGCGSGSLSGKSIFTEPGLAAKAISELQEKPGLKDKDIQIFHNVIITEQEGLGNYIDINILVPDSKDKVDNYQYKNGKWSDPAPVQITGDGDMKDNVMPLSSIDFSKIPEIYRSAEEKAKSIEKGKVDKTLTYIYYIDERAYKAMIKIEGARESYTAMYDAKGKLLEMKKD